MTLATLPAGNKTGYTPSNFELECGYHGLADRMSSGEPEESSITIDPPESKRESQTRGGLKLADTIAKKPKFIFAECAAGLKPDAFLLSNQILAELARQTPPLGFGSNTQHIVVDPEDWFDWLKRYDVITTGFQGAGVFVTQGMTDLGSLTPLADSDDLAASPETTDGWSADQLADALHDPNAEPKSDRFREVVLRAEDTAFTPDQSARLAPRLLEVALRYRDPQDEPIVWSAIRTGASMLRPSEAHLLLPLLEPGHPIETSLVALKMLGRIFEAQPPDAVDVFVDLAKKVRGIADSLLNRYTIAISRPAAMAQLAIYALAALASADTLDVVRTVRGLEATWFTRRTEHKLRELREYWDNRPVAVANGPRELLDRVLDALRA